MNCPNCNHQNIEGATFCGNCGATLLAQPTAVVPPIQAPVSSSSPAQNAPAVAIAQSDIPQMTAAPDTVGPPPQPAYTPAQTQPQPLNPATPTSPMPQPYAYNPGSQQSSQQVTAEPNVSPTLGAAAPQYASAPAPPQSTNTATQQFVAPPVAAQPDTTPLKTRIPVIKQFAITSMVLACLYGVLYLVNIVFSGLTSAELSQAKGTSVPPVFMVIAGSVGLVGCVLTFIGGRMANAATTADKVRKATTLGMIGCGIIVFLAGSLYGVLALMGFVFGFMVRKELKKQAL